MAKKVHYGKVFQKIRKGRKLSLKDFEGIVPRRSLSRYERGETVFPIVKLQALLESIDLNIIDFYHLAHKEKIYGRYGKIFTKIRKQNGFSREAVTHLSISAVQLKLFESGKIMFEFDKLYAMLMERNTSLEDYCFLLEKGGESPVEYVLEQVDLAYYRADTTKLNSLYAELDEYSDHFFLSLCLKGILKKISEQEMLELKNYFITREYWTNQELFIFQYSSKFLSSDHLKLICENLLSYKTIFKGQNIYQRRLVLAGLEIMLLRLKENSLIEAAYFLKFAREFVHETDELAKIACLFVECLFKYKQTGKVQYKTTMKSICKASYMYDGLMKNWYQKNYESYVK
ncbi:transcriptional regulator [Lactococcus petauri]|uniref:Rgg/GadR/MutR family transcriptional regulator n=1 Tax=Lactococcus petauri TaxID=1940789 RepID=UPI003854AB1F